jgi:putative membrane protein
MRRRLCAEKSFRRTLTRTLSVVSAAALSTALVPWAAAADTAAIGNGVTPTCDEAYYATLDYYGNLTDGSVVKSYALNGTSKITDYGAYDSVTNLTDGTEPTVSGSTTTFDFGTSVPDHFYFEGKTSQPFASLPWTISMSYKLNGVATPAEDLAGKQGVVEIDLNLVPNASASEYAKNNYTLEAISLFNQDDILSLKAEGAQVQLIGNLRMVLFMALPGEEQHFSIEVGSDSFTYDGMTFLMVPATLKQLDQIADLSDKKDDIEKDYDKLDGSLDTFLNSLDAMTGSLRSTAGGLDELNKARGTISAGKGDVYAKADAALGDLDKLNSSLSTIPAHVDSASQAVTDVTDDLTDLTKTAVSLKTELADVRDELDDVQSDLSDVQDDLNGNSKDNLQEHLKTMGEDVDALRKTLNTLKTSLDALDLTVGGNENSITLNGMTLDEVNEATDKAKTLKSVYQAAGSGSDLTFDQFLVAAAMVDAASAGTPVTAAAAAASIQAQQDALQKAVVAVMQQFAAAGTPMSQDDALAYFLKNDSAAKTAYVKQQLLKNVYAAAAGTSMDETEFITAMLMLSDISTGKATAEAAVAAKDTYAKNAQQLQNLSALKDANLTSGLLSDMSDLCDILGSDGISDDLSDLTGLAGDTLDDLDALSDTADAILVKVSAVLDKVQALDDTVNQYVPDTKQALADTKTLVTSLSSTISDTHGFLSSLEALSKKAGTQLDSGTKQTLAGLSDSLRKAADSIDTTDTIRSAKDNISDIIKDEWDDHTGDVDNLLNMDSTAQAVSLTSSENAAPESVQVLIRSQEIKLPDEDEATAAAAAENNTTFLGRVANLFKNIWSTITGIFQH